MDFSTTSDMEIAALAVQECSPEILIKGLQSLFLSDARDDYRDILCGLSLYYDAAKLIGLDADNFFLEFGENNKEYSQEMKDFVSRSEQNKALKAFGYKRSDSKPFRYE